MNDLVLIESRALRDQNINRIEVLDKIKTIYYMSKDHKVTISQIAEYYEVPKGTLDALLSRHKEEFVNDGNIILKGSELKKFKASIKDSCIGQVTSEIRFASSLSLYTRRAMLRIGMLLTQSDIAKQVRDYLLDGEEVAKEVSQHEGLMIKMKLQNNKLVENVKYLIERQEEQVLLLTESNNRLIELENEISAIKCELGEFTRDFKVFRNPNTMYFALVQKFCAYRYNDNISPSAQKKFQDAVSNFFDIDIPDKETLKAMCLDSVKNYLIHTLGIEALEKFVNGVISGRIIKTTDNLEKKTIKKHKIKGQWIDLNGVLANEIEWEKILKEWDHSCAYCGEHYDYLEREHVMPKSNPDSTDMICNIVPACSKCNRSKGIENVVDWYESQDFYSKDRLDKIKSHWDKYEIKYEDVE